MIELSKTYKTKGGNPVRIYAVDGTLDEEVHGAYSFSGGGAWSALSWTAEGFFYADKRDHPLNLVEVRASHVQRYWIFHRQEGNTQYAVLQHSKPTPHQRQRSKTLLAITGPHEVTFTEGEGLAPVDEPVDEPSEPIPTLKDDGVPLK